MRRALRKHSFIKDLKTSNTNLCPAVVDPAAHQGLTQWAVVTSLSPSVIQAVLPARSSAPTCCQQLLLRKPSCQTKAQPSTTHITDCPMFSVIPLMLTTNPHRSFLIFHFLFICHLRIFLKIGRILQAKKDKITFY